MLKKVLMGLGALVLVFAAVVLMQPSKYHVERSLMIKAPRQVVFDQVNIMQNRHSWYPWDRLDPNMKITYGDIPAGKGATYQWSGNDDVGQGRQEILESVPGEKVVDSLHFLKPFESTSTATFTFADDAGGTKVTWSLDGGEGFSTKLMNVFVNMDNALGRDFESGLANLDTVAQKAAEAAAATTTAQAAEAPADQEPNIVEAP